MACKICRFGLTGVVAYAHALWIFELPQSNSLKAPEPQPKAVADYNQTADALNDPSLVPRGNLKRAGKIWRLFGRREIVPEEEETKKMIRPPHKVEHKRLLNKPGIWWMMGAIIFAIAAMVVKMETAATQPVQEVEQSSIEPSCDSVEEPLTTRMMRLGLSVVGLNIAMLFWGIAQEDMMTTEYQIGDKTETVPSAMSLVMLNRFGTLIFATLLIKLQGSCYVFTGGLYSGVPAITNLMASWLQYQSLAYVSFPIQAAFKSAKLLPVCLISALRGKRQGLLDWAEALVIVSALCVFAVETHRHSADHEVYGALSIGILCLIGLLAFDALTPHAQDYIFGKYPDTNVIQLTWSMACFSCAITLILTLCNGKLVATYGFFHRHPEALAHACVLTMSSTLTQFLISYTIKTFGPVIFVLIATTRQLISVCISAALFGHDITALAWLAAILVFGTVIARSFRKHSEAGAKNSGTPEPEIARTSSTDAPVPAGPNTDGDNGAPEDSKVADPPVADLGETVGNPHDSGVRRASFHAKVFIQRLLQRDSTWKLLICILGMNLPLAVYSICQEFMATHTFGGELFKYPMFLIAMNRTASSLVACVLLKMQGMRILDRGVWVTVFPAAVNLSATFCQYESLYFLRYPMQSLAKAVKVVPVMICGRLLKNRSYSLLDYGEALLVTGLVVLFMVLFHQGEVALNTHTGLAPGILLMAGYVVLDSFTSNIEDVIYQAKALDPAQMVLGMQAFAGVAAWFVLLVTGQLVPAITFLCRNSTALLPLFVLMFSEAIGCYACTLTVRLFGPAVFTLIMTSHQIISLLISVALFNHSIQHLTSALLVIVIVVVFTSTLRRVYAGEPAKTRGTEESRKQASKQA